MEEEEAGAVLIGDGNIIASLCNTDLLHNQSWKNCKRTLYIE